MKQDFDMFFYAVPLFPIGMHPILNMYYDFNMPQKTGSNMKQDFNTSFYAVLFLIAMHPISNATENCRSKAFCASPLQDSVKPLTPAPPPPPFKEWKLLLLFFLLFLFFII